MRFGLVQFRADKTDVEGSRRALATLAARAAVDVDLLVLPEMAPSGYTFADRAAVERVAEAPDGPTYRALADVARSHRCWVVCGFPERDGDRLFNAAMVLDPSGARVFVYRKTLLYDADVPWATPGDSGYRAFDTDAGRFGVGICMDLNDDRFLEWTASADLDAIAFPTNWVEDTESELDIHTWVYWAWRLQGQRAALVAANTWGSDAPGPTSPEGCTFTGESAVLQGGRIRGALGRTGDAVLRVTTRSRRRT